MQECVVNLSEGRDRSRLDAFRTVSEPALLDLHADGFMGRAVLTLAAQGDELHAAVTALARVVVATLDLASHQGPHPTLGVMDVVPFVDLAEPWAPATPLSLGARDRFAAWAADELQLPCFLYGPERSLPDVRRRAWRALMPDTGPSAPHPTAGAACVGARGVLVAYNLVLAEPDLAVAGDVAAHARRPGLRALAFALGPRVVVSCNLTEPFRLGPGHAYDLVATELHRRGAPGIASAELVGLLPRAVLMAVPRHRWEEVGIGPARTIEAALEATHHC